MQPPAQPTDEHQRLSTLRAYNILDTLPEERFDRLTRLARRLFDVPIALVSLVDMNRQWFKSCQGLEVQEMPRDVSFCGHAILADDIMEVPDAQNDSRFHDNPLVTGEPGIRFYAGCPLMVPDGIKLGTLCLIDTAPRALNEEDRMLLRDLAAMAEQEITAMQLATMDELTQISNRRGFEALGQHALDVCHRLALPASLLFFDMNGFKAINDTFGHAEGDQALKAFAALMRDSLRDSDVVGRLGGDEFAVLLTNAGRQETQQALARLQEHIAGYNARSGRGYALRYSVGQIEYDGRQAVPVADLLAQADALMYAQKRGDTPTA